MATKPNAGNNSGYIQWSPADPAISIEPTVSKKALGFQAEEYPPSQWWNWFWRQITRWINYLSSNTEECIVVSSNSYERDYNTTSFASAIAAAVDGDVVYVRNDVILPAALISIDTTIKLKIDKGVVFRTVNANDTILFNADGIKVEGDLIIEFAGGGTIDKCVAFNAQGCVCENIIVNNVDAGVITNVFYIEAGAAGNYAEGMTTNTGGGTLTNILVDNSGLTNNLLQIREI